MEVSNPLLGPVQSDLVGLVCLVPGPVVLTPRAQGHQVEAGRGGRGSHLRGDGGRLRHQRAGKVLMTEEPATVKGVDKSVCRCSVLIGV